MTSTKRLNDSGELGSGQARPTSLGYLFAVHDNSCSDDSGQTLGLTFDIFLSLTPYI